MAISSSSMPRTAAISAAKEQIERLETRSRNLSPEEHAARDEALKDVTQSMQKYETRISLTLLFSVLAIVTVTLAIIRALPEGMAHAVLRPGASSPLRIFFESMAWLFSPPELIKSASMQIADILAPFLAVSVAIERLLETGFNWHEQSSRAVADVLGEQREKLDWIGREYQDAYQATKNATATVGVETTPEALTLMENAEQRLAKAEERLRSWVSAPEYVAWKKALSIWFGLLAGLVIAIVGDLGMMRHIGIPTPRVIDMLITGLVIGSGPGPMHDLIGILQSGKNALGNLADLAKGKSIREASDALYKEASALQIRREES